MFIDIDATLNACIWISCKYSAQREFNKFYHLKFRWARTTILYMCSQNLKEISF